MPSIKSSAALFFVLAFSGLAWAADAGQSIALKVKAAYLLNFGRYVTWPDSALQGEVGICVIGDDPYGEVLDRTAKGRSVQGLPVTVYRLASGAPVPEACKILYVSPSLNVEAQKAAIAAMAGRPVLTVGDSADFIELGGIVQFIRYQETIRFEVNLAGAREAGLEISSRVLALAVSVRQEEMSR